MRRRARIGAAVAAEHAQQHPQLPTACGHPARARLAVAAAGTPLACCGAAARLAGCSAGMLRSGLEQGVSYSEFTRAGCLRCLSGPALPDPLRTRPNPCRASQIVHMINEERATPMAAAVRRAAAPQGGTAAGTAVACGGAGLRYSPCLWGPLLPLPCFCRRCGCPCAARESPARTRHLLVRLSRLLPPAPPPLCPQNRTLWPSSRSASTWSTLKSSSCPWC